MLLARLPTALLLLVVALPGGCGRGERASDAAVTVPPAASTSAPAAPTASSTAPASHAAPAVAALPAEIVEFRRRRDACDHFRGEEPYDAKRAAFLAAETRKHCAGTDRALAELRRRHAGDPAARAALAGYEDRVE